MTDLVRLEELARAAVDTHQKWASGSATGLELVKLAHDADRALDDLHEEASPWTILHLIQLLKDREGALEAAITVMTRVGTRSSANLEQAIENLRQARHDCLDGAAAASQSLNTGASS